MLLAVYLNINLISRPQRLTWRRYCLPYLLVSFFDVTTLNKSHFYDFCHSFTWLIEDRWQSLGIAQATPSIMLTGHWAYTSFFFFLSQQSSQCHQFLMNSWTKTEYKWSRMVVARSGGKLKCLLDTYPQTDLNDQRDKAWVRAFLTQSMSCTREKKGKSHSLPRGRNNRGCGKTHVL